MCKDYRNKIGNNTLEKEEDNVIEYFKKAQQHKIIYMPIHKYFKYLSFKGLKKRAIKEITILHFPLISYIIFALM